MSVIAGLQDFRQEGPPADIGTFQLPCSVMVFQYTFAGTTYICAVRGGERGWILVDYGAVASTIIQSVFTLLIAGGEIFFARATYGITATLNASGISNLSLAGEGASTIFRLDADVRLFISINAAGNEVTNLLIENIQFDGNKANRTAAFWQLIYTEYVDQSFFGNLWLHDATTRALQLVTSDWNQIYNIIGWDNGKVSDGQAVHFANCEHCLLDGLTSWGNNFASVQAYGGHFNIITNINSYGDYRGPDFYNSYRFVLSNFSVSNTSNDEGVRVYVDAGREGGTIQDGVCYTCATYGVRVTGLSDNLMEKITIGGVYVSTCALSGFYLSYVDSAIIDDCVSIDNIQHGIRIENSDDCIISDNIYRGNDSGNAGSYDGISADANSERTIIAENDCRGNHRAGIYVFSPNSIVDGNLCYFNDQHGLVVLGIRSTISDNYSISNGQDAATTYHAIFVGGANSQVTDNYCIGVQHANGVYVTVNISEILVEGNYCYQNGASGIVLGGGNNDCSIVGNLCSNNAAFGINIQAATCLRTFVSNDNRLINNTSGAINDAGVGTKLPTLNMPFIQGTTFLSADGAPWGWEIDADTEFAIAQDHLPLEVQQVVRWKIWAIGLAAPGAGNTMALEIVGRGGASDEPYTTESVDVINKASNESNFAINDVISWTLTSADDVDVDDFLGGDIIIIKVKHEAASGTLVETDAVFLCAEIEYV